mgnify:CR=1 FL=1
MQQEHHVYGMSRQHEKDQKTAEVEQMLNRVHRQAGPGADIDIPVVHRMHMPVQRRPVDQAMDQIEVDPLQQGQQREKQDKPYRTIRKRKRRRPVVGIN